MSYRLFQSITRLLAIPAILSLAALSGCGGGTSITANPLTNSPISSGSSNNWQFEVGSAIGTPVNPAANLFMAGAMQIQGTQVTGTFNIHGICLIQPVETIALTGSYNAATRSLVLNPPPAPVSGQFTLASDPTQVSTGTMEGLGQVCALAEANVPAVGEEIPTLTNTFTGTVASSPSGSTGTATLAVTQSTSANADGTFPLTGSLKFANGTCASISTLTGTINGASYTLTATGVTVSGLDNTGGTTLPSASIAFANGLCGTGASSAATYTGALAQQ